MSESYREEVNFVYKGHGKEVDIVRGEGGGLNVEELAEIFQEFLVKAGYSGSVRVEIVDEE